MARAPFEPFHYEYVGTREDLLDAFEADRRLDTGMRPIVRGLLVLLGIFFLFGVELAIFDDRSQTPWFATLLWFSIGAGLLWFFLVRPWLLRREISHSNPEEVSLAVTFDEDGILTVIYGSRRLPRDWSELVGLLSVAKGLVLYFEDGVVTCLPQRVFPDEAEKVALAELLARQVEANQPAD